MKKEKLKIAEFFVKNISEVTYDIILDAYEMKPSAFPTLNSVVEFLYSVKKDYENLSLEELTEEVYNDLTQELLRYVIN